MTVGPDDALSGADGTTGPPAGAGHSDDIGPLPGFELPVRLPGIGMDGRITGLDEFDADLERPSPAAGPSVTASGPGAARDAVPGPGTAISAGEGGPAPGPPPPGPRPPPVPARDRVTWPTAHPPTAGAAEQARAGPTGDTDRSGDNGAADRTDPTDRSDPTDPTDAAADPADAAADPADAAADPADAAADPADAAADPADAGIVGLTGGSRTHLASQLFTALVVLVFAVIVIQLVVALVEG